MSIRRGVDIIAGNNTILTSLFDFKWSDHLLNEMSWLRADTFSWQSGDVYKAAYEHLLDDFENRVGKGTDSDGWLSETIDGVTVYYVAAPDGHKICVQDNEANVQALYEKTGVAWYYILDIENKQFKLPRTKWGFTGLRDSVGGYVEAGLPDIAGRAEVVGYTTTVGGAWATDGSLSGSIWARKTAGAVNESGYEFDGQLRFNASHSNSIYGNSDTVQPPATQMYLYFYVGNFEQSALEQTAGITSEQLNNKANISDVVELQNNKLDKSAEISLVPTGSVTAFAGTTPPTGWLKCDGSAISRTTYAALFNVIGTTYGAGNGSTTFNLPTQSVLPLGIYAPVSVGSNGYAFTLKAGTNIYTPTSNANAGTAGVTTATTAPNTSVSITNLSNRVGEYNSGLSATANLANATGAKAIVCIKY